MTTRSKEGESWLGHRHSNGLYTQGERAERGVGTIEIRDHSVQDTMRSTGDKEERQKGFRTKAVHCSRANVTRTRER